MLTKIWTAGEEIAPSNSPVYCRTQDKDLIIDHIKSGSWFPQIYAITPNGEDLLDLVHAYQRISTSGLLGALNADPSLACTLAGEIIKSCYNISQGLQQVNSELIISGCTDLSSALRQFSTSNKRKFPPSLTKVADYFQYLAIECIRPIELSSPFIHQSNSPQHKSWWNVQASLVSAFAKARKRFDLELTDSSRLIPVRDWIGMIEFRLKKLQAIPAAAMAGRQTAFIEASAFCYAVAERNLLRGHHGQSILLLHRASDLLLISLCIQHNAIDFTYHGGRYFPAFAPPSNLPNSITIKNSLNAISNKLSYDPNRSTDFEDLNNWRNLLIQTHYMTDLDLKNAVSVFSQIRQHLEALGGSAWNTASKQYLEGVQVKLLDVLDSANTFAAAAEIVEL